MTDSKGDARGDPLARRAAALLRDQPVNERAIERVIEALREHPRLTDTSDDAITESLATPRENRVVVGPPRFRFSLGAGPALAAATLIFALGLAAGTWWLRPRTAHREPDVARVASEDASNGA